MPGLGLARELSSGLTHIIEIAVGVSRRLNLTNQTRLEVEIIHANVTSGNGLGIRRIAGGFCPDGELMAKA